MTATAMVRKAPLILVGLLLLAAGNAPAGEAESFPRPGGHSAAVIVVGQAGSHRFRMEYEERVADLYRVLRTGYGYPEDRIFLFTENGRPLGGVEAAGPSAPGALDWLLARFPRRLGEDDPLLLILIGHANRAMGELYIHTRSEPITASSLAGELARHPGPVTVLAALPHAALLIEPLGRPGNVVLAAAEAGQRYQPAFLPSLVRVLDGLSERKEELTLGRLLPPLEQEIAAYYAERNLLRTEHSTGWPEDRAGAGWERSPAFADAGEVPGLAIGEEEEEPPPPDPAAMRPAAYWRKIAAGPAGDGEAPVTVLFDESSVEFGERMDGRSLQHRVMLIRDREGRGQAEVGFPFNRRETEVILDWARTILPDGRVVEIDRERDMQFIPGPAGVYRSIWDFRLYFPRVEAGAIVEYRYRTRWGPKGGSGMLTRVLQPEPPTERFHYRVTLPARADLNLRFANLPPGLEPSVEKDDYAVSYSLRGEKLPALAVEEFAPPAPARALGFSISPYREWGEVARWYQRIAAPRTRPTAAIEELAAAIVAGAESRTEKLERIYRWMLREIRYVHVPLGDHAFQPFPAERTYRQGYGDCKDKAALMISLLEAAGLEGYFALVRAGRTPPVEPDFPTRAFNHAIVAVPAGGDDFLLLDPTSDATPFGCLPVSGQGRWVLVVHPERPRLLKSPRGEPERNLVAIRQTYDRDGRLTSIHWEAGGDAYQGWRGLRRVFSLERARDHLLFDLLRFDPVEYRLGDFREEEDEEAGTVRLETTLEALLPDPRPRWTDWPARRLRYTRPERTQPYYLQTGFGYRETIEVSGRGEEHSWARTAGPLRLAIRVEPGEEATEHVRELYLPGGTYDLQAYRELHRALMEFERKSRKLLPGRPGGNSPADRGKEESR